MIENYINKLKPIVLDLFSNELKCTDEYTNIWIENIKELRRWLKELLIEK